MRRALFDLSPSLVDTTQRAVRHVVLIVVSGAYVVFSLVLALILSLSVLLEGVSTSACLVIALVWLVPTYASRGGGAGTRTCSGHANASGAPVCGSSSAVAWFRRAGGQRSSARTGVGASCRVRFTRGSSVAGEAIDRLD